jgi:hypothetical protein
VPSKASRACRSLRLLSRHGPLSVCEYSEHLRFCVAHRRAEEFAIVVHAFRHNTSRCIRCDPPDWHVEPTQRVTFKLAGLMQPLPKQVEVWRSCTGQTKTAAVDGAAPVLASSLSGVCHVSGLHRRRAIDGHDVRPGWAYPAATDGWFEHQPPAPIGAEGELQVDIRADCMYYLRVITGRTLD